MKGPQEDPAMKRERKAQLRLAQEERKAAAQQTAQSLTSDMRAIYGIRQPNAFTHRGGK